MVRRSAVIFLSVALVLSSALLPVVQGGSHGAGGQSPREIAEKIYELNEKLGQTGDTTYIDEQNELTEGLSKEQKRAVDEAFQELMQEKMAANDRFKRQLANLQGDEWAAYMAAFFSSTLFETDKSFDQALAENLTVVGENTGRNLEEVVTDLNAEVRQEAMEQAAVQQAAEEARLKEIGKEVLAGYDTATDAIVTDSGFLDYARSNVVNRSGLMVKDGFVGNTMKTLYQMNILKTGTGEILEGNFLSLPPNQAYGTANAALNHIGRLEEEGADSSFLEAKTDAFRNFVELPGMAPTEEHFTRRSSFIEWLEPRAQNVADNWQVYSRTDMALRQATVDFSMWQSSTRIPNTQEGRTAYGAERDARQAEIDGLKNELANMTSAQSDYKQAVALNQHPFLSAPVEVEGFEGPLWQYLSGEVIGFTPSGDTSFRTAASDQLALDQAIAHVEGLTADVLLDYGTIVNSEELIRTFGSPNFKALRVQLADELEPMIPGAEAYFGELEGLFDREWAETEYSRTMFDVGTGLAAIVVGGVIIIFPVTAPVLVPVEVGLLGTQLGVETVRLVIAEQNYSAAEDLAQSGSGDNTALLRYGQAVNSQALTWSITVALAPLGLKGSAAALDEAARLAQQTSKGGRALVEAGGAVDDVVRLGSDSQPLIAAADNPAVFMRGQYGDDVAAARAYEIAVEELGLENVDGIAGSYARGNPRLVNWPDGIDVSDVRGIDKAPDGLPDNLVEMLPDDAQRLIGIKRDLKAGNALPSDLDLPTTVTDRAALDALQERIFNETGVYIEFTQSRIPRANAVGMGSGTQRFVPGTFDPAPPPGGAALDDTQIFPGGVFPDGIPSGARAAPDIDDFRNMTPEGQAAALDGLSESAQAQLTCQLSKADQQALGTAKVYNAIVDGIRRNPESVAWKPPGRSPTTMTAGQVAGMTDDEIRIAVRNGDIILDQKTFQNMMAEVGEELQGPFNRLPAINAELSELGFDLPPPGYFSGTNLSQQQVEDLFRIDVDSLTVAERQQVILKRADVLRQPDLAAMVPPSATSAETVEALTRTMISHMQKRMGQQLTPDQLFRAGWRGEWGPPPAFTQPHLSVPGGSSAMESGSTIIGGESGSTIIGGMDDAAGALDDAAQAPVTGWRLPGDVFPVPGADPNAGSIFEVPDWLLLPPRKTPGGGGPSFLRPRDADNRALPFPDDWFDFMPGWFRRPPGNAAQAADDTQVFRPGVFDGGVPGGGTCGLGNSADAFQQGSALVYLHPYSKFVAGSETPLWRKFMYRSWVLGRCQGDWTMDCGDDPLIGVLSVPAGSEQAVANSLNRDPQVAYADANAARYRQDVANDPLFGSSDDWESTSPNQWALHRIGLADKGIAWPQVTAGSSPVVVAIIDSGLAWSHPDFSLRNLWINEDEIPGNELDDDQNGYIDDVVGWNMLDHSPVPWDFDGHGTLVASIIAAQTGNGIGVAGVNPAVQIMPLKAINNDGDSRASYLAEAIVYATNNGARIINLSVGGEDLTLAESLAIDYARSKNALVVVAAGNEGQRLDDYGPAGATRALTVAASDPNDERLDSSNWGTQIDLTAPGKDVLGLRAPATDLLRTAGLAEYQDGANFVGDGLYYRATGTSFAAPLVSGTAALLLSQDPGLSADQLERLLLQSAVDIGAPGVDPLTGYGRLNASAALSGDPDYFIDARIAGVVVSQADGTPVIEVRGRAGADRYRRAWLELGAGDAPGSWRELPGQIPATAADGVLLKLDPRMLAGEPQWTLRLVVEHADGSRREARYLINLN